MGKKELVDRIVQVVKETPGLSVNEAVAGRIVKLAVEGTFEELANELATSGQAAFSGFGTFTVKERAERPGRNPRTGEDITIAASKTVGFKPAKRLRGRL